MVGVEKFDDLLTLEEQNKLLDDLMHVEVICMGFEEYLKSINKFDEAIVFVRKFVEELDCDKFMEWTKEKGESNA